MRRSPRPASCLTEQAVERNLPGEQDRIVGAFDCRLSGDRRFIT
jgi:hypothetical protein